MTVNLGPGGATGPTSTKPHGLTLLIWGRKNGGNLAPLNAKKSIYRFYGLPVGVFLPTSPPISLRNDMCFWGEDSLQSANFVESHFSFKTSDVVITSLQTGYGQLTQRLLVTACITWQSCTVGRPKQPVIKGVMGPLFCKVKSPHFPLYQAINMAYFTPDLLLVGGPT